MFAYILMHFGFLFYSFYTVLGKIASRYEFLSLNFCIFYCILIAILFVYAILWQQVLKRIELSIATASKGAAIVWGMLWSVIIFKEKLELHKVIGAAVIIAGIFILAYSGKQKESCGEQ